MYEGTGDRLSEMYRWYCGGAELARLWNLLVPCNRPKHDTTVLVAGIGNDPTPIDLCVTGYTNMIAFDYNESGVARAKALFGRGRSNVTFLTADARNLPLAHASIHATVGKRMLDAIYITGPDALHETVRELGGVTAHNGIVVSVRAVFPAQEFCKPRMIICGKIFITET